MARGKFVAELAAPVAHVPSFSFLQEQAEPPPQEGTPFVAREEELSRLGGALDKHHRLVKSQSSQRLGTDGPRLSRYRFRHILFQRYLYHSLDEVQRVYLHEAVGNALEQLYGGRTEEIAVELAWHFQVAGLVTKAVDYLHLAGEKAVRLSAREEAISHFTKALKLLETLPDPSQHAQQELNVQIALGNALIVVKVNTTPPPKIADSSP